jgi:hypothetical protein
MPDIAPLGYIIGGGCDREHRARKVREETMLVIINHYLNEKLIVKAGPGWFRLKKNLDVDWRELERIAGPGADVKIAWYRFKQDLVPAIQEKGKKFRFRLKQLKKWAESVAALQLGMDAESPLGPWEFGYAKAHADGLYQKRKQMNDF